MINLTKLCVLGCVIYTGACVKKAEPVNTKPLNGETVQIKTMTRLLIFEEELPIQVSKQLKQEGTQYSDKETQVLMRAINSIKGSKIITTPSIVSRAGESATIEIIREVAANGIQPKTSKYPWLGHSIKLDSSITGEAIDTKLVYTYHYAQGMKEEGLGNINGVDFSKKVKIEEFKTTRELSLGDGNSQLVSLKAPEGVVKYLLITQSLIDATGKKIKE